MGPTGARMRTSRPVSSAHLAQGRLLERLARVGRALRQRPGHAVALAPPLAQDQLAARVRCAQDDPTGRGGARAGEPGARSASSAAPRRRAGAARWRAGRAGGVQGIRGRVPERPVPRGARRERLPQMRRAARPHRMQRLALAPRPAATAGADGVRKTRWRPRRRSRRCGWGRTNRVRARAPRMAATPCCMPPWYPFRALASRDGACMGRLRTLRRRSAPVPPGRSVGRLEQRSERGRAVLATARRAPAPGRSRGARRPGRGRAAPGASRRMASRWPRTVPTSPAQQRPGERRRDAQRSALARLCRMSGP